MDKIKKYKFPIIMILSVIVGSLIGLYLPKLANIIKPIGDIYLNLMFTIVVPLVFFTIASAIANMKNLKRLSKVFRSMIIVFFITSVIASIVMIIGVKVVNIGTSNIKLGAPETIEASNFGTKIVEALTVSDFKDLFSKSHMLPLIIFTVIFGVSVCKSNNDKLKEGLRAISEVIMNALKLITYFAPIGLCAYFAGNIKELGESILSNYLKAFILYVVVGLIYYFVFYTIYAYIAKGKEGVKSFYKYSVLPMFTALVTQSSLASLPANMECAHNMKVNKEVADIALPVGSTINMHGSVMGAILKISFLFSVFNLEFSGFSTLLLAVIISILSGMVMSGIPGGGLIGEMLIVSLYNLPLNAFPVIATIGIIIDAPATILNVIGNTSTLLLVDKYSKNA